MTKADGKAWTNEVNRMQAEFKETDNAQFETIQRKTADIDNLIMVMSGKVSNKNYFDIIKPLYDDDRLGSNIADFVANGLITEAQYQELTQEQYEPNAQPADYESALSELGVE